RPWSPRRPRRQRRATDPAPLGPQRRRCPSTAAGVVDVGYQHITDVNHTIEQGRGWWAGLGGAKWGLGRAGPGQVSRLAARRTPSSGLVSTGVSVCTASAALTIDAWASTTTSTCAAWTEIAWPPVRRAGPGRRC